MIKTNRKIRRFLPLLAATLFCGIFAFAAIVNYAKADSVKQLTIQSNASFGNRVEGAWKIDENATVLSQNKIRVKYDVNSILKGDGKKKDIFIMTDVSGSMTGARINQHIDFYRRVLPTLVTDGNRVAMGTFNNEASLYRDFTTSPDVFANMHHDFPTSGGTSYYEAFKLLNEFFADYVPADDTSLIILFLTDGAPMEDTPAEIAEYQAFKNNHPYALVQGIQYELGDTVIPGLISVSDNQFVSNMETFEDVFFDAVYDGYKYSEFRIENQLNSEYYSVDSVEATMGTVDTSNNKVRWVMDNDYRSGTKQSLTVDLTVKDACFALDDARCKVNSRSIITSKLDGANDETIDTTDSVIIQFKYDVVYDLNTPATCSLDPSTAPATTKQIIFSTVQISNYEPACDGYAFKAWTIVNDNTTRMNDDYFLMPEENVTIRALWAKASISKSMDGTIAPTTTAQLAAGRQIGFKNNSASAQVERVAYSDTLPVDFTPSADNTVSTSNSELPIYTWYDSASKTAYFYSDADIIYMNPDSSRLLYGLGNLKDISGLSHLDSSRVESLFGAFSSLSSSLNDLSPIADWDTSNVTNLSETFNALAACDLTPLADWNVSNVVSMAKTFANRPSACTTLAGIENWDVSNVETMQEFLLDSKTENISALAGWNTASLKNMSTMFTGSKITSVEPLAGWDTSQVTTMYRLFDGASSLSSLHGLEEWDVQNLTSLERAFQNSAISNISALADWKLNSLTTLTETFNNARNITSLESLSDWDVSHVTSLAKTFSGTSVTSLQPLEDWDVTAVKDMYQTFQISTLTSMDGVEEWKTTELTSLYNAFHPNIVDIDALADWDVRKVTNMREMFAGTKTASLAPLRNWKTDSLENLIGAFQSAKNLTSLSGLEDWNVTKLTTAGNAFNNIVNLESIEVLADWQTNNLRSAYGMFSTLPKLTSLSGLEDWVVSTVNSANGMFAYDGNLENINALNGWRFSSLSSNGIEGFFMNDNKITSLEPIRNLGLGDATSLSQTFKGCGGITDFEPISGWDTSKITSMISTFVGTNETNLNDLAGWDVSKVKRMDLAFSGMDRLTDISGLSAWQPIVLENISGIFSGDENITSLNGIENFGTTSLKDIAGAFRGMTRLSDITALSSWNVSKLEYIYNAFWDDVALTSVEALRYWNVESVKVMHDLFNHCTGISDFTPLNNWPVNSSVSATDRANAFLAVDPDAILPTWVNN